MTRARWICCLSLLSVAAAYGVFTGGADGPFAFSFTLLLVGLAGCVGFALIRSAPQTRHDRFIDAAALLFPAYVALQLVPLPLALVRVLSPARAEVADALGSIMTVPAFVPLSVAPPATWTNLMRIAAYALVFFGVRQLIRRSPYGIWTAVVPVIAVGAAQAAWGLMNGGPEYFLIAGSYPNRNHFAGVLELTLPFALAYGLAVLYRSEHRGILSTVSVVKSATLLGVSCMMFSAIALSGSKAGFLACLLSLGLMTALAFGRGLRTKQRTVFLAGLALIFLAVFVLFTPLALVQRFESVTSNQPTEGRLPIWQDAVSIVTNYPVFGSGLGTFFPTLLKYHTVDVDWAWTHAHNDYVQLLAELGIAGFVFPAVLMVLLFSNALGAAAESPSRDARLLAIACAGSLAALFVHSVTDFNTYVTANGLVLAWVGGIASSLPRSRREAGIGRRFPFGFTLLPVGLVVALFGAVSLIYLTRFSGSPEVERALCKFGVCDTVRAMDALQQRHGVQFNADLPPDVLLAYLPRDPAAPYRWDELGYAFQVNGRAEEARRSFARAVELGPTSASTLLMAADFHFAEGDRKEGFELLSRGLRYSNAQTHEAGFNLLDARGIAAAHVVRSGALTASSAAFYLRWLLSRESLDVEGAAELWRWMVEYGAADGQLARDYSNALIGAEQEGVAWQGWTTYAAQLDKEFPTRNLVFNGGFEIDSEAGPFDWLMQPSPGVALGFDKAQSGSAGRALRIQFDGTQNVRDIGVVQEIYLEPGRYVFRARVRAEGVSTDEGVAFRISSDASQPPLGVSTEAMRGTSPWTTIEQTFEAPPSGGIVAIRIVRRPSWRFDNLISGTVWVDEVSVRPE